MTVGGIAMLVLSCGDAGVEPPPPSAPVATTVAVSPGSAALSALGERARFTAEVRDQSGQVMEGAAVAWTSSDASVAPVDASGLVTAVAKGSATITAVAGSASGTAAVTVQVVNQADREALVALYEATDGPNWVNNENWLTDAPLREWYGVDTDASGRVVALFLQRNRLVGTIPPDLGNLTELRRLRLGHNDLTGTIPSEVGKLTKLRQLELNDNNLTGTFPPEILNLGVLETLHLDGNGLKGMLPPGLGSLGSLRWLDLSRNPWTGAIPPELGNLANLESLRLYATGLTGPVPPEFGNLVNLTWLRLDGNRLTGAIPPELGNLTGLTGLFIGDNNLTGAIPPALGSLANLEQLDLGINNLTGAIPPELGNLANLRALVLGYNRLSGTIPQSLAQVALDQLLFEGNNRLCVPGTAVYGEWISGITEWQGSFCNASDMAALEALFRLAGGPGWSDADGWLDGPVLSAWQGVRADTLGRVAAIDLSNNRLVGRLPPELGELAQLAELRIGGNANLSGHLPFSLRRLGLEVLHYAGTGLCAPAEAAFRAWLNAIASHEGTVECAPLSDRDVLEALYHATGGSEWTNSNAWLTAHPLDEWYGVEVNAEGHVTVLRLESNGLRGSILPELGNLVNSEELGLAYNKLTGAIPPKLGNLARLVELWISGNG